MPDKEQIIEVESLPLEIISGAAYLIKQANLILTECLNIPANLFPKYQGGE